MDKTVFVQEIESLCIGSDMPDRELLATGKLPENWAGNYLCLLSDNRNYWQNVDKWSRRLSYCFYRVGFHLGYAYSEWCRTSNDKNLETERILAEIRLFTEAFIVGKPTDKWDVKL